MSEKDFREDCKIAYQRHADEVDPDDLRDQAERFEQLAERLESSEEVL